jgi:hypothetical protein
MADYRDELGALHARIESLERELEEARAKGEERGPDSEAARELARAKQRIGGLSARLQRTQDDLADARREAPKPAASPQRGATVATGIGVFVLLVLVAWFAAARNKSKPAPPTYTPPTIDSRYRTSQPLFDCAALCQRSCAPLDPGDGGNPYLSLLDYRGCISSCQSDCAK